MIVITFLIEQITFYYCNLKIKLNDLILLLYGRKIYSNVAIKIIFKNYIYFALSNLITWITSNQWPSFPLKKKKSND